MKWYNPLTWFEKDNSTLSPVEAVLYCDNPQCGEPIESNVLPYSKQEKEIYHNSNCVGFANGHKAMKSNEIFCNSVEYISKDKALTILKKGKLKQSSLEGKVE